MQQELIGLLYNEKLWELQKQLIEIVVFLLKRMRIVQFWFCFWLSSTYSFCEISYPLAHLWILNLNIHGYWSKNLFSSVIAAGARISQWATENNSTTKDGSALTEGLANNMGWGEALKSWMLQLKLHFKCSHSFRNVWFSYEYCWAFQPFDFDFVVRGLKGRLFRIPT